MWSLPYLSCWKIGHNDNNNNNNNNDDDDDDNNIKALKVEMEDDPEDFFPYSDTALNSKTLVPSQDGSMVSVSDS